MMTETNVQTLLTQTDRQSLLQKLNTKYSPDVSKALENHAYERSGGDKILYYKNINESHQKMLIRQSQQRQQQASQAVNSNGQFLSQTTSFPQLPTVPMINQLHHPLNQQTRFPSTQPTNPSRMLTPSHSGTFNQTTRLREPQTFNSSPAHTISYTGSTLSATPVSIQTVDISQNYPVQQQKQTNSMNPTANISNDYQPQLQNRHSLQQTLNSRPRPSTTTTVTTNSNDVLHQFVVGNPPTNSMVSTSSTPIPNAPPSGDRLLQQILLANHDGTSNRQVPQNRTQSLIPSNMSQPVRSASTTNSISNSNNTLRSSLLSQSSSLVINSTPSQISNVQVPLSTNTTVSQGLHNGNISSIANAVTTVPPSRPIHSSTPINRSILSSGSGPISNPDEDTTNLIKYFKDNVNKLQSFCQKFTAEGNLEKARNAQAIYQQMAQFINNPTYETLAQAKHIREILERASNRLQQQTAVPPPPPPPQRTTAVIAITPPATITAAPTTITPVPTTITTAPTAVTTVPTTTTVALPTPAAPNAQINNMNQFKVALTDHLSRDQKKRMILNDLFVGPLSDVVNGIQYKKLRLDNDTDSVRMTKTMPNIRSSTNQSVLSYLNNEIALLPPNIFSIEYVSVSHSVKNKEFDPELLSKGGIVLRCKLLEPANPLIPPLRLRVSTRYPEDQPEILSLTQSLAPKLEFTEGHPFFEQLSALFVAHVFKLDARHTVTDILIIWRQSIQAVP